MIYLILDLTIDPEFQNKIPPLSDAEYKQLEENIISAGEVYEPITVWNDTIIDGHNRYKIILNHPELKWRTREMQFDDKWQAFDWMYKNQLGRRNLTDEQRRYLLGKLYEARKHTHGGDRKSEDFSSGQNGALKNGRVRDQIMKEQNVGQKTVERSEHYAHGIDAIREEEPALAESILKAETKVSKVAIQDIGQAKPEYRPEMIQAVKDGTPITAKEIEERKEEERESKDEKKKRREDMKAIREAANELFKPITAEYNIDSLLKDIENNASPFVRLFRQIVEGNKGLCAANKETVTTTIHTNIILKIEELEKEILSYE